MRSTYVEDTKAIISRPWIVFAVLVVISLALCGLYANEKENGVLHRLQTSFSTIVQPLSFIGNSLNQGVVSLKDYVSDSNADPQTMSELREENQRLQSLLAQSENNKEEAERLKKILNYKDTYNIEGICAKVIGRSTSAWNQTVTAGCGSDDGVSAGQTVIGVSGVVGQVISVAPKTCTVRLLTDPNSGIAVQIKPGNADCILKGSLDGVLSIDDLDVNAQVQVGDSVVTSGLGGSYVEGLVVGKVSQIIQNQSGSGRKIIVTPLEQDSSLSEVLVVKGME